MNEHVLVVEVFGNVAFLLHEEGGERRAAQGGQPVWQLAIPHLEYIPKTQ